MAEDASVELSKAHIALLRADAGLTALVNGHVYDFLNREIPYPYVHYHIEQSDSWDDSSGDGEELTVTIHIYSEQEGSLEIRQILRVVHDLIQNNTALALTDHNLVNIRRTSSDYARQGQVYHGIGLYRAVTEETA